MLKFLVWIRIQRQLSHSHSSTHTYTHTRTCGVANKCRCFGMYVSVVVLVLNTFCIRCVCVRPLSTVLVINRSHLQTYTLNQPVSVNKLHVLCCIRCLFLVQFTFLCHSPVFHTPIRIPLEYAVNSPRYFAASLVRPRKQLMSPLFTT